MKQITTAGLLGALAGATLTGVVLQPSEAPVVAPQEARTFEISDTWAGSPVAVGWPLEWSTGACTRESKVLDGKPGLVCDACAPDGSCKKYTRPLSVLAVSQPFNKATCMLKPGLVDGAAGKVLQCTLFKKTSLTSLKDLPTGVVIVH